MFWADEIVEKLFKFKKPVYLVSDYKTPSGKIHIGALRGVIIHDIISRALKEKGLQAKFCYGFDDFDAMDSLPIDLPISYKKYLGMPLSKIPSPEKPVRRSSKSEGGGLKNYSQFYAHEFKAVFAKLGVMPEILWTSELYKSGKFNQAIKIALENASQIRKIYLEVSGSKKPKDWHPFQVICPKCGKIGTTRVFDFQDDKVKFICEKNLVKWAAGCGYQGKISPYNGNGKLPWKLEWVAKWFVFKTDFEGAGKDLYTKGGARDVSEAIARQVYKIKPPLGLAYEFFLVAGKKMATSKGVGVTSAEIAKNLPPALLRFLMVRTQPQRPIEFDPEGDTIPRLYDLYDEVAESFWSQKNDNLARVFDFSQIEKPKKVFQLRFSKVAFLIQMPNVDIKKEAKREKGGELTEDDLKELKNRAEFAKKWLKTYAPESFKFKIQKQLPKEVRDLKQEQRKFLRKILELIEQQGWTGEDLHSEIHEIRKKLNIDPREAFSSIYLIFTGKDSGPQAGWFLASLDRKFVLKRLKDVVK